ncbi:MAG TPA: hypothetical protein VN541_16825 [Tepidisphaeraceae bacterium]|nr:hypothetical protein [Tepidisphaeraceae bacterium]
MTILLDPLTPFASPSTPQGEEAPAPKLWANPPRIVDVEFRVQCDSFVCNLHKGPNLAGIDRVTGNLVQLFNPRRENWTSHFRWEGLKLIGLTQTGRVTIDVLNINDPLRIAARETLIKAGAFRPQ